MNKDLKQWIGDIYEKAEHWSFETRVEAPTAEEAMAQLKKDYPKREYTVRGVFRGNF